MTTVCGKVNRIVYNKDMYYILKCEEKSSKKSNFTVVGNFGKIAEGQCFNFDGDWSEHDKYGINFKAKDYSEVKPTDIDGIVGYLGSGLIKGIGKVNAHKIVEKFGEDTLRILKEEPDKLLGIGGIGKKKLLSIIEGLKQTENIQELQTTLKQYEGIGNKTIYKIYDKYKENAMEVINDNPFKVCKDIDGFGFKIADKIAQATGVDYFNKQRLKEGVKFTLEQASTNKGHLFLRKNELIDLANKSMERKNEPQNSITLELLEPILEEMEQDCSIVVDEGCVYLKYFHTTEVKSGEYVRRLLGSNAVSCNLDKLVDVVESKLKVKYANKQRSAIKKSMVSKLFLLTGGPGTGKTTTLKGIIEAFKMINPNGSILCIAPTGRASKRMTEATGYEAKTIHRALELKNVGGKFEFFRNKNNPLEEDLIICDESSMIDMLLFYRLIQSVKRGGKIVFVGDADQLPSVGAGNVFADLLRNVLVPKEVLDEIFRQEDTSLIVVNAHKINQNEKGLEFGEDFQFIEENEYDNIGMVAEAVMMRELKTNGGRLDKILLLSPFREKTLSGTDELNRSLQKAINKNNNSVSINTPKFSYKIGDRVMQMKNNYNKGEGVFNGDIGTIKELIKDEKNHKTAKISFEGEEIEYSEDDFDELNLAYANTIHKSQGSEADTVIIIMSKQHYALLFRNIIYTAITRAKRKVIIIGQKQALYTAIKNNKEVARNSRLYARI